MPGTATLSRRQVIHRGIAGGLLGSGWAIALRAAGMPNCPTLSIVGAGASQLALVDTTRIRALLLLGTPGDLLIDQVPALLTVLRQRIDLMVGDAAVLDSLGAPFRQRWAVRHRLAVPSTIGGSRHPDPPGHTTVARHLALDVGNDVRLELRVAPRQEWMHPPSASQPAWSAELTHAGNRVLLAPDTASAVLTGNGAPSLVVAPGDDPLLVIEKLSPAGLAINGEQQDSALAEVHRLQIFPKDIARIELRPEGLRLPTWTVPPDPNGYSSDSGRS